MLSSRKARIASAFGRAKDYESHAHVQRTVADRLATRILALDVEMPAPALEIGCGTGFLTKAVADRWPELSLTVSDVAPAMVERARAMLGQRANLRFDVIDGEAPGIASGSLGLIMSSLAFQWFENPRESIARLIEALRPGGRLAFSTLVAGSFREWVEAQRKAGLDGLTPAYPEASLFKDIAADCEVDTYSLSERHPDGTAFLRSLKAIGAGARWSTAPSRLPALRQAIKLFEEQGAKISYEIAEVVICKKKK